VQKAAGRTLQFDIRRGGEMLRIPVTPERDAASGLGMIKAAVGVQPETTLVKSAPLPALGQAVKRTWDESAMIFKLIGKMIVGESSWKNLSGPITIADAAKQSAHAGLAVFLSFIAFISVSLGVMNLLPIPVLDGGHLLYYSLEVLTGRPVPERIGEIAQRAGVGLLFILMALAVFNDLVRLF
jgi:regulator of sigma E protease